MSKQKTAKRERKTPLWEVSCQFCGRRVISIAKKHPRKYCCHKHYRAANMMRQLEKRLAKGIAAEWESGFYQRLKKMQERTREEVMKETLNRIPK
ncbi:hypothetical protein [Fervidibacter sacchari]